MAAATHNVPCLLQIPVEPHAFEAELHLPPQPLGVAVIAHGADSGRHSPRNRYVARLLRDRGFGTLMIDCADTDADERMDSLAPVPSGMLEDMARRVAAAADWLREEPSTRELAVGYLGSGLGGAASLLAALRQPKLVSAVVTRGARTGHISDLLPGVLIPTLLIVGSRDLPMLEANREALQRLGCREKSLEIVPGAGHMFEEPGALAAVALHSANWFARRLANLDRAAVISLAEPALHVSHPGDSPEGRAPAGGAK